MQNGISNLDFLQGNDCTLRYPAVSNLVELLTLDVIFGEIVVLEHEIGFHLADGHIARTGIEDHAERQTVSSNFVSADFRKMRTDSFQKSRTTRFRKIRVVR